MSRRRKNTTKRKILPKAVPKIVGLGASRSGSEIPSPAGPVEVALSGLPTDSTRQMKEYDHFRKLSQSIDKREEEEAAERARQEKEAYDMPMEHLRDLANQQLLKAESTDSRSSSDDSMARAKAELLRAGVPKIAASIQLFTKQCGWSQRQLARVVGVDHTTVADHWHGRSIPQASILADYARGFAEHLGKTITPVDLEQ